MPPSKQARAAQERQKQRLASGAARKRAQRRRMQWVAGIIVAVLILGTVGIVIVAANSGGTNHVTVNDAGATSTTVATSFTTPSTEALVAQKPCVGFKDTLPKGAPAVPITAGPAPTKLVTKDIKVGSGATVAQGASKVTVNYIGVSCSTGKIFDSSWSRNQTFDADLNGGVIPGWELGIPGMKVGGERLLEIPENLAYGAAGNQGIPPKEALFFVVDVVKV